MSNFVYFTIPTLVIAFLEIAIAISIQSKAGVFAGGRAGYAMTERYDWLSYVSIFILSALSYYFGGQKITLKMLWKNEGVILAISLTVWGITLSSLLEDYSLIYWLHFLCSGVSVFGAYVISQSVTLSQKLISFIGFVVCSLTVTIVLGNFMNQISLGAGLGILAGGLFSIFYVRRAAK